MSIVAVINYLLWICAAGILGFGLCVLVLFVIYYIRFKRGNPLFIKTFCGYDEPYHPSVLYFPEKFGDYQYWMAETPFPGEGKPYRDRWECPCIHASENGYDWHSVGEDSFPLNNVSSDEIAHGSYHSDPHLFYAQGQLECWYRYCQMRQGNIDCTIYYRRTSCNGVDWTPREEMCVWSQKNHDVIAKDNNLLYEVPECGSANNQLVLSPAIIYHEGFYHMWTCLSDQKQDQFYVAYAKSSDGKHWSNRQLCVLTGSDALIPWHLDVYYRDGVYHLLIYDRDHDDLLLYKSRDGQNFKEDRCVWKGSRKMGSYYYNLYRASMMFDGTWKIYFSSSSMKGNTGRASIGLLEGGSLIDLRLHQGPSRKFHFSYVLTDIFARLKYEIRHNSITRPLIPMVKRLRAKICSSK